jgi:hypothetical protein
LDEASNDSFKERRSELVSILQGQQPESEKIIISSKPKKNNANMSTQGFRGSSYRGVSKNKNKWQVIYLHFFKLLLDDDHGKFQKDVCWSY